MTDDRTRAMPTVAPLIRLLRAEVRKASTTRLWWGMLLGSMVFSVIGVVAQIASNGAPGNPMPPLTDGATQRTIVASAAGGDIFALIVGVILITTEFRHLTSRPTFLLEPRRGRVIAAKLVVAAGVGLLYGAACVAISVAIIVPWLAAKSITIGWVGNDLILVMLGVLVVVAIFAMVGVGVGVLCRNQVAAVISALAYLFVVEPLLTVIPGIKEVARYLPEASADALIGFTRNGVTLVSPWQGGLLLLAWGLLFVVLGWVLTVRRDIP
jgi:ABC-2 type transport system permease protein